MGVRGEYSPAHLGLCLKRNLPLGLVAPRWLGSRTRHLPKPLEGQGGWGSLHVPVGLGESQGEAQSDLESGTRFGLGFRGARGCSLGEEEADTWVLVQ